MWWNAKNGSIPLDDGTMAYAAFGRGSKTLVLLPGLGDGLKNVSGMALPLAWMYRAFAKDFRVLVLSRKVPLEDHADIRSMAKDVARALTALEVERFSLVGVSMGGMIAQHLAADCPLRVEKLVLVVTCPGSNTILEDSITHWTSLAKQGNHRELMVDNGRRIYSDGYLKKYGWMFPIAARFTKPSSYRQFLIMAEACRTHDAWSRLSEITASTLVVGGEQDQCLGADGSRALAAGISGAQLKMYAAYGHGAYEEAIDFQQTLLEFLKQA